MEYCVQYRESDFAFISRLMEEFGIYYYFDHSKTEHTMILADGMSGHEPKVGGINLSFYDNNLAATRKEDSLNVWNVGRSFRTGKFSLNDYDYNKPTAELLAYKDSSAGYKNGHLEHYEYPGRYIKKSQGEDLANILLEAEQAKDKLHSAAGQAVTCAPGKLIKLAKHSESSLEHRISDASRNPRLCEPAVSLGRT